jgi:hypothetical protein
MLASLYPRGRPDADRVRGELDPAAEERISQAVADSLLGLGGLQRLLDDPLVENIAAVVRLVLVPAGCSRRPPAVAARH